MKSIYSDFEGKELTKQDVESLLAGRMDLSRIIAANVIRRYGSTDDHSPNGNEIIVGDVLLNYLTRILNTDKSLAPLKIVSLEKRYSFTLEFSAGEKTFNLLIGGVVDRIDVVKGTVRIVDYKTGTVAESMNLLSDIFEDDRKKDYDGWLQTLVYCEALYGKTSDGKLRPSIYKIRKNSAIPGSDKLRIKTDNRQEMPVEDYSEVREAFIAGLKETVSRIFSENEPFIMTDDRTGKCRYCIYKSLCMR
jgi:hypothetical protein